MKNICVQHFIYSFLCMLMVATISAYLQNTFSIDRVGTLVFLMIGIIGLIFSIAFAWFQKWLQQSVKSTVIFVLILSVYLVVFTYMFHVVDVDWNAVLEGQIQLTLLQKFLHSEWSIWLAFLFPFCASWLYQKKVK
ncbi:hypothetical protein [Acinetobacter sp. CFCC 10889]|uniref:hypothetical protein n=1 Tax=Acinetobacter sp. CFCC 10889 TaxID=1775557 RepID=UPI000DCF8273|nr:hypothetical protein [Acinetobacter sp. CFCC 10889]